VNAPRARVLAVGDELLSGAQLDTNSAWLAGELARAAIAALGFEVVRDDEAAIELAVRRALGEVELLFVSGGLGPPLDDVTRHGGARAFGRALALDEAALADVRAWFARRDVVMSDTNRRQALFPRGATVLANRHGTAPGFRLEHEGRAVVVLPGPPRELQGLWADEVLPWLAARGSARAPLPTRSFYLFGLSESLFAERAGAWMERAAEPLMGVTAREGVLSVTLRARAAEPEPVGVLEARAREFRARFAAEIYSESDWELERALARALLARGASFSAAESCTGGLVLALLTSVPGISAAFARGYVAYSDAAKTELLAVPHATLAEHGAVSRATAEAMALGVARASGADLALAVTGLAGPDGGSAEKPVGLVWFATVYRGAVQSTERRFPAFGREAIRRWAARTGLYLALRRLGAD
jgi:nicotinamide-nucleotide amidase